MSKRPTYPHRWRPLVAASVKAGDRIRWSGERGAYVVGFNKPQPGGALWMSGKEELTWTVYYWTVYAKMRILVYYPRP
jgi:hypothetical protein